MRSRPVIPCTPTYRRVRKLFLEAFPPEERRPFWSLWLLSVLKRAVSLRAWLLDGTFCGFTLTVCTDVYLYISFIAVSPEVRSRGCGTRILDALKESYGKPVLVEIEAPEEGAENQTQRLRRREFYLRNGFSPLNREITGRGVRYELLSTGADYDREAYMAIFPHLSFGIVPRIKKLLGR